MEIQTLAPKKNTDHRYHCTSRLRNFHTGQIKRQRRIALGGLHLLPDFSEPLISASHLYPFEHLWLIYLAWKRLPRGSISVCSLFEALTRRLEISSITWFPINSTGNAHSSHGTAAWTR
ncbi:hypothetical protein BD310DRAFT_356968 [Dichomitus squalens]|uniref:Uncharacterized protein n=1 Tax=Dichomitus squalens TaxID=114155 RepID=A0A4Q9PYY2_9APHY|nr:hypothetical protein BD310DRAFT_356968 [Dichomitus squalens]